MFLHRSHEGEPEPSHLQKWVSLPSRPPKGSCPQIHFKGLQTRTVHSVSFRKIKNKTKTSTLRLFWLNSGSFAEWILTRGSPKIRWSWSGSPKHQCFSFFQSGKSDVVSAALMELAIETVHKIHGITFIYRACGDGQSQTQHLLCRNTTKRLGTRRFLPHKHRTETNRESVLVVNDGRGADLLLPARPTASVWGSPSTNGDSEETNQALALLYLLLNFVTGRGDLGLSWEDGADEGEQGAAHCSVEGPAHGAEAGAVRRRIWTAVQLDFVGTPASGVQHQTQNQEQTCQQRQSGDHGACKSAPYRAVLPEAFILDFSEGWAIIKSSFQTVIHSRLLVNIIIVYNITISGL